MADNTKIEWTGATWNPITGCSIVSPGCTNCYAMKLAGGRLKHHPSRKGLTQPSKAGPAWTGEVRFNEQWLTQPLRWKKPRKIFVCAHGDLFAENVPNEWIDRVFAVMALCPQHTFQVLTKRADRMREYVLSAEHRVMDEVFEITLEMNVRVALSHRPENDERAAAFGCPVVRLYEWPLPNVWLGVSVEDQERADQRIPDLLATPAAVRFISAEPLLGPVYLNLLSTGPGEFPGLRVVGDTVDALTGERVVGTAIGYEKREPWPTLDWTIVGGESGQRHRPMDLKWARDLRDQCKAADVPYFFKQTAGKGDIPPDLMVREFPGERT